MRRWLPQGLRGPAGVSVFETGGSTGRPKARINIDDFRIDYEMFSDTLPDAAFPRGADWLSIGPTGPRRLRLAVEHLAQHRGGICFMLDLDPRWVIKLLKWQELDMFEKYKKHVIDQAVDPAQGAPDDQVPLHDAEAARGAVRARVAARRTASPASSAAAPR